MTTSTNTEPETTPTPYRSHLHPTHAGFPRLLHAEWTKFRTVRAWLLVLVAAAVATVLITQLSASGSVTSGGPDAIHGPDGTTVTDSFRFTHRPLTGDGSVTARVTGLKTADDRSVEPWAKAGLIVKSSLRQGSSYAAVLATPGHGVRMQWNFTHDTAGSDSAVTTAPRWLRLTRTGDRLTGYESADGANWSKIEDVSLSGLPKTVQVGLVLATPGHQDVHRSFGGSSQSSGGGRATATYDHLTLRGTSTTTPWTSTDVGAPTPNAPAPHNARPDSTTTVTDGTYTLTGQGDIAPDQGGPDIVQMSFQGVFVGILFMIALGALFVTGEYKRGLIRTTFTATPARLKVLAAKTTVIGAVTFVAGLAAVAVGYTLAQSTLRGNGFGPPAFPDYPLLENPALRAVLGSAALLSLVAVLALAVGVVLRNSAGAIATVVMLVILPQILSFAFPLPAARWLLRVTPAAAFAVQQGVKKYDFTSHNCLPEGGCYPLSPGNGLTVLAAYTAAALLLAAWTVRRRDA
ncbi:ABC transporter permease subunit [Streptomyces pseudovenezuelae]|uniref:ABC-type transport system involved in multi-copper enzyme maturation permease subunit n=1 Tax=Streptomyces pseudovenezuelae TaxID=67350 RepID=A0ABT6LSV5_9ACTN|nr:ABC transporter permease subunit [Streptomyces pseudovenezuelae]MDH6219376.1 ABC-type transport system involved in multi-copper enzyme maturation permease subunit [Streptomyces pseudovenezuelae]